MSRLFARRKLSEVGRRRTRKLETFVALVTAWSAAPLHTAGAAADPIQLTWDAPPGCPSGASVLSDVQRILGGATEHHASARGVVTAVAPDHFTLQLATDIDGARGERTVEANSCDSLAQAAALILAWSVDPERARSALGSAAPGAAPQASSPTPTPTPGEPRPSASAAAPKLRVLLGAGAVADHGTLPSPGAAVEVTLGVLAGAARFELSGQDWWTQTVSTNVGGSHEGTHLHLLQATARGCFRGALSRRFELDPCAGAGLLFAKSDGFGSSATGAAFSPSSQSVPWATLDGTVLAVWQFFGPFALRVAATLEVPLTRADFVVQVQPGGSDVLLHRPDVVAERATLGIEARFP